MRIWTFILTGAGLSLSLAAPALAGEAAGSALPVTGKSLSSGHRIHSGGAVHRWGPRVHGRWFAGWRAPGGWMGYRRPVVGYVLPGYWMSPAYRIGNYGAYGLPVPGQGYGWSRYYDDTVMVDDRGRVQDHRRDVDWDRHDGDGPPSPGVSYDDDVTAPDGPAPDLAYDGRWTGTWKDKDGKTYSGEYEGRFEGNVHGAGVDYDAPAYAAAPAPIAPLVSHHGGAGQPIVTTTQAPGYFANGYYYPGATTTTVVMQPAVTTSTSYVTETVRHPVGRRKTAHRCNCE